MTEPDPFEGYNEYNRENWDGDGAKPITTETLELARAIARLLARPPDIAPCADGSIGFEWVDSDKDQRLCLDVESDNIAIYGYINRRFLSGRVVYGLARLQQKCGIDSDDEDQK